MSSIVVQVLTRVFGMQSLTDARIKRFDGLISTWNPSVARKFVSSECQKPKKLIDSLKNAKFSAATVESENFHIQPVDLNNLDQVREKIDFLIPEDEKSWPTCFIFECVLVYMTPEKSAQLLVYLSTTFPSSVVVSYEQVNLNDRFGQVMLENLVSRGCGLAGYDACLSVDTQTSRFESAGFTHSKCELMTDIYQYLPGRLDIEKLEFLDDVDIFNQLLQHYSITTSTNTEELTM